MVQGKKKKKKKIRAPGGEKKKVRVNSEKWELILCVDIREPLASFHE